MIIAFHAVMSNDLILSPGCNNLVLATGGTYEI